MEDVTSAGVAQLVEQLICNQQVGGSSPSTSSTAFPQRATEYGGVPEWPKGADCKSVVSDFGGSNPPSSTKHEHRKMLVFFCSRVDSKGGSWQAAGGGPQPPWLFRRKAKHPPPPNTSIVRCSCFFVPGWIRKAAPGRPPGAGRNRRGFSAEKRNTLLHQRENPHSKLLCGFLIASTIVAQDCGYDTYTTLVLNKGGPPSKFTPCESLSDKSGHGDPQRPGKTFNYVRSRVGGPALDRANRAHAHPRSKSKPFLRPSQFQSVHSDVHSDCR